MGRFRPNLVARLDLNYQPETAGISFSCFPGYHQHVPVGQLEGVVMLTMKASGIVEGPDELAVPIIFVDASARTRRVEGCAVEVRRAQEMTVLQQIGAGAGEVRADPAVDQAPLQIDEIGTAGNQGRKQDITGRRQGAAIDQPDRVGCLAAERHQQPGGQQQRSCQPTSSQPAGGPSRKCSSFHRSVAFSLLFEPVEGAAGVR